MRFVHLRNLGLLTFTLTGCGSRSAPPPEHAQGFPGAEHQHGKGDAAQGGHDHHDFHDAEHFAKLFDDPARDAWQHPSEVVKLLDVQPGMTVADIGAGTGYFLPHLARAVSARGRVLGLDVEPAMVRYMEQRIAREHLEACVARLVPYADPELAPGSVDRILIVNTWHHIEGRPAYAAKLRAALKPEGRVMIVDFTRESPHGPPAAMRLAPEQIKAELEAGGLAAEIVPEDLPYQYVVSARAAEAR